MEKLKNFFTLKNIKKITVLIISTIIFIFSIIIVSLKINNNFRPAFFNYKSYIAPSNEDILNKNFEYKTFNEINEFTIALNNNKAVGGIGSDFQAASLIQKNLIRKIDFKKLLKIDKEIKSKEELKTILSRIYTPIVFKHLESYDGHLGYEEDGTIKHLWEYFVPYYAQDGVVAYNTWNKTGQNYKKVITEQDLIQNKKRLTSQIQNDEFKKYLKDNSLYNILSVVKEFDYKNLVITDAVRVNMLYGSSFNLNNEYNPENHTGVVTDNNFQQHINSFVKLINESTQSDLTKSRNISFNGDGQGIIASLLDPNRVDVNVAIMYNGDALDAYYSEGNGFNIKDPQTNETIELPDGSVEVIKFNENILLVDGLVIASDISESTTDILYNDLTESIFKNLGYLYNNKNIKHTLLKIYDEYLIDVLREKIVKEFVNDFSDGVLEFNEFKSKLLKLYEKTISETLNDDDLNLFRQFTEDEILTNDKLKLVFSNILNISLDNIEELKAKTSFLLSHIDFANESFEKRLNEDYPNLVNFDFINYTPANIVDYSIVRRNYFINDDNTYDLKAIDIYEITDKKKTINHKNLSGVSDKLQSLLDTYYFSTIKR
ncbi:hypothetical protein [Mycoplasmopsis felis]|uniref:hypothetical protein n=1 Tax=Mycoplasmopsis felis TaxID=33923 RepID=UPI002AFF697B|nr:hypothetical protein [Mycoplasmopsis felis]WQQ06888.1 hypothetical protein RRG37_03470 [Mycoplasmopsis felis]